MQVDEPQCNKHVLMQISLCHALKAAMQATRAVIMVAGVEKGICSSMILLASTDHLIKVSGL
jgi:hypothetical protein